jgi:PAS domain S-box-containing protein
MITLQPASPSDHATNDEAVFEALFHESPFPLVVTSLVRDMVLAVNRRATEVFHVMGIDAVGGPVTAFYTDPEERASVLRAVLETGQINDRKLRLRRRDGSNVWVLISSRRVTWNGESAALGGFVDLTPQLEAEQALADSEHRLAEQSRTLTALTERSASDPDAFQDRIDDILRMAAGTLGVARLSLWRFASDMQFIECVGLLQGSTARNAIGSRIRREDCPPYFDALEAERVIAAHDARIDTRTSGFTAGYLDPNGIGAMLDVPLRYAGGTRGVLCAEHVGGARTWTLDEQNFAISVANLIAVAVAESERRQANARLAESEARAKTIIDTAHDAFVGIDTSGRIVEWNTQACATFGWTRSEALGRSLVDTIIPPAFRAAHAEGMRRFHATGEGSILNRRLELSALHRSGREFPVELTVSSPIRAGRDLLFGAFLRDISERKAHESEISRARVTAEHSRDRLDRELASAGDMQKMILPPALPVHERVRFAAHYRTSLHAGGDYYDVIPIDAHRIALVVVDVSGHGASAAIVMAMIRAVIHTDCGPLADPAAVMQHLNRHFRYLWDTAMYATAIVAVLDVERGVIRLSSAGHPPPLVIREGQVAPFPAINGPLLFWGEIAEPVVVEERLRPGDRVVFYTDGITDRIGPGDTRFETPRLMETFSRASRLDLPAMIDALSLDLDAFAAGEEPDDDQTVLAIELS